MVEWETLIHRGPTGSYGTNKFEIRVLRLPGDTVHLIEQYRLSLSDSQWKKLHRAISSLALRGPSRNPEKNSDLTGHSNLFELKEKPCRIFYFYDKKVRNVIVLTHGFNKHQNSTPKTEIRRALELRELYQQA